jgi:hypothetical protein
MADQEKEASFRRYLKAFWADWSTRMSGPATVPFTFLALYFPGWVRFLFALLAIFCGVFSSYRVWRTAQLEAIKLRVRPYDDSQAEFVKSKLATLTADGRDILRFLLRFGPCQQFTILHKAQIPNGEMIELFATVVRTNFLQKLGQQWSVHPNFRQIIEDELFPRKEDMPERCFVM